MLLQEAIHDYELPIQQHYAIGDVGTTIYEIYEGQWHLWRAWEQEIAPDWKEHPLDALVDLFIDIEALRLQEPEKQYTFKLSYYVPLNVNYETLLTEMDKIIINTELINKPSLLCPTGCANSHGSSPFYVQ